MIFGENHIYGINQDTGEVSVRHDGYIAPEPPHAIYDSSSALEEEVPVIGLKPNEFALFTDVVNLDAGGATNVGYFVIGHKSSFMSTIINANKVPEEPDRYVTPYLIDLLRSVKPEEIEKIEQLFSIHALMDHINRTRNS